MQSKTRWCPPQSNVELMAEKQILGFRPGPRLEQVGEEHSERVQDRKLALNDAMILPYDANPGRTRFSERTGLGRGYCLMIGYDQSARKIDPRRQLSLRP